MRVKVSRMELGESQSPCRVPPAALAPALCSSASRGAGHRIKAFYRQAGAQGHDGQKKLKKKDVLQAMQIEDENSPLRSSSWNSLNPRKGRCQVFPCAAADLVDTITERASLSCGITEGNCIIVRVSDWDVW